MTADNKISLRALIKNTRMNHNISLADAISSSKSSLSRFENGKTELAVDLMLDTFDRVGLSFFDLHVQTNHFTPFWEQTADQLQLAIVAGDEARANRAIAAYAAATATQPSPLDEIYMILFHSMQQLCDFPHVLKSDCKLTTEDQHRVLDFLAGKTVWHMLDFMLLQYSQWFMTIEAAQTGFDLMAALVTDKELGNPNFLYRLAFFDAAVTIAQHLQMFGKDVTAPVRALTSTALQIHMSPQRALLMHLIIAQNQPKPTPEIATNISSLRTIGLAVLADRLQLWHTTSCDAQEATNE